MVEKDDQDGQDAELIERIPSPGRLNGSFLSSGWAGRRWRGCRPLYFHSAVSSFQALALVVELAVQDRLQK
jgi:hypothetical protein